RLQDTLISWELNGLFRLNLFQEQRTKDNQPPVNYSLELIIYGQTIYLGLRESRKVKHFFSFPDLSTLTEFIQEISKVTEVVSFEFYHQPQIEGMVSATAVLLKDDP
ncbi:MAG: hypothetical protein MI749_19825, partial [Desulfovibrionales bacterium]|nr:hypothetical protein [Desulfovibrionales bacterium]